MGSSYTPPVNLASPGPIGGTTPAAGTFTTVGAGSILNAAGEAVITLQALYGSTLFAAGITASGNSSINFGGSGSLNWSDGTALKYQADGALRLGGSATTTNTKINLPALWTDDANNHGVTLEATDTGAVLATYTNGAGVDDLAISINPSGSEWLQTTGLGFKIINIGNTSEGVSFRCSGDGILYLRNKAADAPLTAIVFGNGATDSARLNNGANTLTIRKGDNSGDGTLGVGNIVASSTIKPGTFTVSGLAALTPTEGDHAVVSDAVSWVAHTAPTGGGSVTVGVYYSEGGWVMY